jgi:hypothetical protein
MATKAGTERKGRKTDAPKEPPPDNRTNGPTDEEIKESLLLRHMDKLRRQKRALDEALSEAASERKEMTTLYRLAKADGFPRKMLAALLEKEARLRDEGQAGLQIEADLFAWAESKLGIPIATKYRDLFDDLAPTDGAGPRADPATEWEVYGYGSAMRGADPDWVERVPADHIQDAQRGYNDGVARRVWALSEKGVNPERDKQAGDVYRPSPPQHQDEDEGEHEDA